MSQPQVRARTSGVLASMVVMVVAVLAASTLSTATARATSVPSAGPVGTRAMWVWTQPPAAELVSWAVDHHVGTIFLQVPADLVHSGAFTWARSVTTLAHRHHLRVAALNGDPGWLSHPGSALEWARSSVRAGLFDGLHVDVEPWATPAWSLDPQQRRSLTQQYLSLLRQLRRSSPLPVEADISFFLDRFRAADGKPLDEAVMRAVDAVTVMTYRHQVSGSDGILGLGAAALRTARRTGTPCRLAVETGYLGPTPVDRKQTFDGLGRRALDAAVVAVDRSARSSSSYAGVAVHHYDSWRGLTG